MTLCRMNCGTKLTERNRSGVCGHWRCRYRARKGGDQSIVDRKNEATMANIFTPETMEAARAFRVHPPFAVQVERSIGRWWHSGIVLDRATA